MSSYDPYDAPIRERERTSKRYYREERDPRYEPRDGYLSPVSHDLVPRAREDSDLSVEEIRRDFPPPGYSSRDIRRARSAGGAGHYDEYYDDRRSGHDRNRDYEPRSSRKSDSYYYEEEQKKKARVLSKQEQIIAAITGAAIAIGGKELYDRRDAKVHDSEIQRNVLASAALGAAGALAGYSGTEFYNKQKVKDERKSGAGAHRGRSDYSSDEEDGKEKKGHKNFLEAALAAAGLGGTIKALTGGGKDDKSDTRSRGGSDAGSRSGKGEGANKIQKAAMASLIAGATEAFRVSKEPGSWKGEKAKRILTAAAGAATIDAAQKDGGSKFGLAESVIGGLVGNRVIHGSKKNIEEDEKTGRSRSRSRARSKSGDGGGGGVSGLAALATAGLGALGAKKIMDGRKDDDDDDDSRSRRRRSVDSRDSRDGSPKRHRSRSRSVVDKARRGLAKLGLGNAPEEEDDRDSDRRDRSRRDYDDYDDHKSSRRHRDDYDDYDRDRGHHKSSRRDDYSDEESSRHHRSRGERSERGTVARRGSASSTDLGDTDEDEKRGKKMRGKQIITTGLATVATIHAAASVYQSMEKRKKRQKAVREGLLSPEEAKKLKQKAMWQDAASVGIAALGIKGAISEMQEVAEVRHEVKEWETSKEERRQRRRDRLRRRLSELRSGGSSDSSSSDSSGDEKGSRRRNKGNLRHRADNGSSVGPPKADRYGDGPRYSDGNPYAALPPPPGGRSDRA